MGSRAISRGDSAAGLAAYQVRRSAEPYSRHSHVLHSTTLAPLQAILASLSTGCEREGESWLDNSHGRSLHATVP